jgi:hypothetical protein
MPKFGLHLGGIGYPSILEALMKCGAQFHEILSLELGQLPNNGVLRSLKSWVYDTACCTLRQWFVQRANVWPTTIAG